MTDRVGEVYHWTGVQDDIILVVADEGAAAWEHGRWKVVSLLTTKPGWLNEAWFDGKHDAYIKRLA